MASGQKESLPADAVGNTFALLLIRTTDGEDELAVFAGTLVHKPEALYLDRGENGPPFEIRDQWIERIRPANAAVSAILNDAAYFLPLVVSDITDEGPTD